MKVVFINTYKSGGGAAIACKRLKDAIEEFHPQIETSSIFLEEDTFLKKYLAKFKLAIEKGILWLSLKNKSDLFKFSLANIGTDISNRKEILEANIVHFHWVNNAFISLETIKKILELDKTIVWTMHDMWAFTGGCHYSKTCQEYLRSCSNCIYLKNDFLSKKILKTKQEIYSNKKMSFVGCSNWIKDLGLNSSTLRNLDVTTINNPIDSRLYKILDKANCRKKHAIPNDKFVIMFASANLHDPRKGLSILLESLSKIDSKNIHIVLIGENKTRTPINTAYSYQEMGFVNDTSTINELYCASDVFACPSLEDNLPNTVMESLCCGTPAIAFNIGGLSDLITNELNGRLIEYDLNHVENFKIGIEQIITNYSSYSQNEISSNASDKYSYARISNQYVSLYKKYA